MADKRFYLKQKKTISITLTSATPKVCCIRRSISKDFKLVGKS